MLKNYITTAFRNIIRMKGYSFINIAGLAVGIACCILIMLWVVDEWNYDRFHERSADLYRVMTEAHYSEEGKQFSATPAPLGDALKEDFPQIEQVARLAYSGKSLVKYGDLSFYENRIRLVDPAFLTMFTFPFIKGSPETALADHRSVVITEDMAVKYFGETDPTGQTLNVNDDDYQVTGVVRNVPKNSHIQFDMLLSFELVAMNGNRVHWGGHFYRTYVLLQPGASFQELNAALPAWTPTQTNEPVGYFLQPVTDIHLRYEQGMTYIIIFASIAAFVLLIAIINFVNISTARSHTRALEVGMRKVVGAGRFDLVKQFFGECFILAFIATLLALFLVEIFLPGFNHLAAKDLTFQPFADPLIMAGLIGVVLLTTLLSGFYPSILLSSFLPAAALKGTRGHGQGKLWFRRTLVVGQFTLSITLIACTIVVYKQLDFSRNKDLGFNKELMVSIPLRGDLQQKYTAFKAEVLQQPGVAAVTAGSGMPNGRIDSEWGQINWEGKDPNQVTHMYHYAVDANYLDVFEMQLLEGRNFSSDMALDTMNFILNEAAVKATGLDNPVGTQFTLLTRTGTIIGVVKDFHTFSTHYDIEPLIIRMMPPDTWRYAFVKLNAGADLPATLAHLEETWQGFLPGYPFEYEFLDQQIDADYRSDLRMGKILNTFALLAMFIAALGLFSMASFKAEQRTKEIGIRKVLGATVSGIVLLLSKEFALMSIMAAVIATPLAWFAMSKWLQNFAFRTSIDLWIFLAAGLAALLLALLTVSYQAIKAGLSDPVKSLRYE